MIYRSEIMCKIKWEDIERILPVGRTSRGWHSLAEEHIWQNRLWEDMGASNLNNQLRSTSEIFYDKYL